MLWSMARNLQRNQLPVQAGELREVRLPRQDHHRRAEVSTIRDQRRPPGGVLRAHRGHRRPLKDPHAEALHGDLDQRARERALGGRGIALR